MSGTAPFDRDDVPWRVPAHLRAVSEWTWRMIIIAVGVYVVGWLFLHLRLVTVPLFVALIMASVLRPAVEALRRRGWPPILATWTVLLAALGASVAIGFLMVPRIIDEMSGLGGQLDGGIAEVEEWLETGPLGLDDVDLWALIDRGVEFLAGSEQIIDGVTLAAEIIAGGLLALVIMFFLLKDGALIINWLNGFIPTAHRTNAAAAGLAAWTSLGAYVRGTAIVGVVNGSIIGLGLAIIGVPLVVPLAVITAISAFFPLVGAVVAGVITALIALFSGGVTDALLVVGLTVVVQQVEGDVLSPIVMGRALRLHPLVILIALTIGAIVAGILGAFLAVPLVGAANAAINAVAQPTDRPPTTDPPPTKTPTTSA